MSSGTPTYDGKSPLVQGRTLLGQLKADEDLTTVGQAVYVDYAWGVKATTGSTNKILGLTLTKATSGNRINVVTSGLVYGTAAGVISAGECVYAGVGSGRVEQATAVAIISAGCPIRAMALSSTAGAGSGVYLALF